MVIDFSEEIPAGFLSDADLCIVGAGAAGITLAKEFAGRAQRVLLIESGGTLRQDDTEDLYRSSMAMGGKTHRGIHEGRTRVFGGTTTLWGGQALPLSPMDFETREWVAESGWPFSAAELRPYFNRAGAMLGLNDVDFDENVHQSFGLHRPDFDPALVEPIYSRWSPQPNFAIAHRRILAEATNIQVLQGANVTQILPTSDGTRVEGVEVRSLGGKCAIAHARVYVICCGGIETARLLLASNRAHPEGLGNRHNLVGRFFQDHLSVRWADFVPASRKRVDAIFNSFFRGQTKYYPFLAASEQFQREYRALNISASVVMDTPPNSGLEIARRLFGILRGHRFKEISFNDVGQLVTQSPEVVRAAWRIALQHRSYAPAQAPLYLGSTIEQEPNYQSRVSLGDTKDALGMRRVVMDWRLTPLVRQTLAAFALRVRGEFERAGLGQVNVHPWVLADKGEWAERMHDVNHHIGTTRMHKDAKRGVVDADCRMHGVENLYLASSSVFPTGGHSNPTFTLLLLCFRLADQLYKLL